MKQKIVITAKEDRFMQKAINFLKSVGESVESNGNYKERLVNRAINGMPWSNHNWAWSFLCSADEYKQAGFIHFSMPEDFEELKTVYRLEQENIGTVFASNCLNSPLITHIDISNTGNDNTVIIKIDKGCYTISKEGCKFERGDIATEWVSNPEDNAEKANSFKAPEYVINWSLEDYKKQKKVVFTNSIGEQFTKKYLKKHKVYWVIKEGLIIYGAIPEIPSYSENDMTSEIFKTEVSAETWKKNYIAKQAKKGIKWDGKEFVEMKLSEMEYHAKDREDLRDVMMKLPIELVDAFFNTNEQFLCVFLSPINGRINNNILINYADHIEVTKEVFINAAKKYICE